LNLESANHLPGSARLLHHGNTANPQSTDFHQLEGLPLVHINSGINPGYNGRIPTPSIRDNRALQHENDEENDDDDEDNDSDVLLHEDDGNDGDDDDDGQDDHEDLLLGESCLSRNDLSTNTKQLLVSINHPPKMNVSPKRSFELETPVSKVMSGYINIIGVLLTVQSQQPLLTDSHSREMLILPRFVHICVPHYLA
jgi:hypothetical protein